MLILDDHKMVWVSCPRSATHALYKALSSIGGRHPTQPLTEHGWPETGFHDTEIPEECSDYRVIGVRRNPYARAVSCWRVLAFNEGFPHGRANALCTKVCGKDPSLSQFVEGFLVPRVHEHYLPCWDWYESAGLHPDYYLATEALNWHLGKIGINNVDVQTVNPSGAGTFWTKWYQDDPAAIWLVQQWGGPDFEHLGYNR